MRRLLGRALPALAMALGIALTSFTTAQAQPTNASAAAEASAACGTWQYRIEGMSRVFSGPDVNSGQIGIAYDGYYLNATVTGSKWYYGTFYNENKTRMGRGWIMKANLDYITCW